MFFPIIDSQTQGIIETAMEKAYNYYDFVQILNDIVNTTDPSEMVVFFAAYHASHLFDFNCLDKIAKKYGNLLIVRPYLYMGGLFQGKYEDAEKAREVIDTLLSSEYPDWFKLEMLVTKFEVESIQYPKVLFDSTTADNIERMLEKHPELAFYKTRYYDVRGFKASRDGDLEATLRYTQDALAVAIEYDDIISQGHILRSKALYTQPDGLLRSIELLNQAHDLLAPQGDKVGLADVLFQKAKIKAIRGEYDQAIEDHISIVALRQDMGRPIGPYAIVLSTLFNAIRDGESGLEWSMMAEAEVTPTHRPRAKLGRAWSLVLLGRISEATSVIDEVRESILKSGMESQLAALYLVNGVLEAVQGDFLSSESSLKDALEIFTRRGSLMSRNICLQLLASTEVQSAQSVENGSLSGIGPWLMLLEENATLEDLPGILGQALLLKSEILILQERLEESKAVLQEVKKLVEDSNLDFLNPLMEM
jgi:tetratricopeptide (TPR) repeat protein